MARLFWPWQRGQPQWTALRVGKMMLLDDKQKVPGASILRLNAPAGFHAAANA